MAAIFTVIRGTGFNISHSMGVADNLLVIATGGALFGGIWIWLSRQATVGTTARRRVEGPPTSAIRPIPLTSP